MSAIPQVLHHSARAVTAREFSDTLHAACAPRFPWARGTIERRIGRQCLVGATEIPADLSIRVL